MTSNFLKGEQIKEECKNISKRFYCYECNFLFSQKSLLDLHMEKHCQYQCPNCDYTAYAEDDFRYHKQSHECGELLHCFKCDFTANRKESLNKHKCKHTRPFACNECDKTFTQELYLKAHFAKVHMKRKYFSCNEDNCSFTTDHKSSLVNHERSHTRPFLCRECGKGFTHEKTRNNHFLNDHKNVTDMEKEIVSEPFSCTACNFKCQSKSIFQDHINVQHASPSFICRICSYKVHSESMLKSHMIIHEKYIRHDFPLALETPSLEQTMKDSNNTEKDYISSAERKNCICGSCGHNFKNHLHLKWHLLTHGNEKYFSCSKCRYKTKSSKHFKSHSKKHIRKHVDSQELEDETLLPEHTKLHKMEKNNHKKVTILEKEIEPEPLSCTVCYFKSMYKEVLQEHINAFHTVHTYICKICNYEVDSESVLKSHMVTHENDKMQNTSDALDIHIEEPNKNDKNINKEDDTISEEKMNYTCTICGHNFAFFQHLKWHLLIHGDEKYFSCSECEYKTKKVYNFKKHSKQHIGKLLACQECYYKTKDVILLVNHMKNHERDVNMKRIFFSCNEDTCSFTTNHKSSLINHIRKHTRPFLCNKCGKGFTHEKIRDTHFSIVHGNVTDKQQETEPETFSCTACEFKCGSKTDFQGHINNQHLKPSFICEICSYEVDSESTLKSHMITHENDNASEFPVASKKLSLDHNMNDSNMNKKGILLAEEKNNYTCSNCSQNFKSNLHLKWHLLTHGDETYFSCSECEYKTKKGYDFESHSKTHIGKLRACLDCNYITEDEITFMKHMKTHKKERRKLGKRKCKNYKQKHELSFICSYCSVECTSLKKLTHHIQNHDNGDLKNDPSDKLRLCPAKNSETLNIFRLRNDVRLSEEPPTCNDLEITNGTKNVIKTFSCGINGCEEKFSSLGILKEHIDIHKEKIYYCNDCDYKCYSMHELEKHECTHREHPFIECDIRGNNMKEFDTYKNTVNSLKDHCTGIKKRCPKCKISFSSMFNLARHLKSHTVHNFFTCNFCTYKDKRLYNVVIHREKVHGQLSRLKCDMCSFKTCVLKRLEAHKLCHDSHNKIEIKDVNTEVKENQHLISHDNIDSVHQIPTEKFSIKSKILSSVFKLHRKNKILKSKTVSHLDKKMACSMCNSTFMSRWGLRRHMYTHNKEKRWSCSLCPFKTHWAFSLKQHVEKCTGIKNI